MSYSTFPALYSITMYHLHHGGEVIWSRQKPRQKRRQEKSSNHSNIPPTSVMRNSCKIFGDNPDIFWYTCVPGWAGIFHYEVVATPPRESRGLFWILECVYLVFNTLHPYITSSNPFAGGFSMFCGGTFEWPLSSAGDLVCFLHITSGRIFQQIFSCG